MSINELEFQRDHFCEDCAHCEDCGGWDDGYGAPMYVEELTCPALGDPEDLGCPKRDEYLEILEEIEAKEEAFDDE